MTEENEYRGRVGEDLAVLKSQMKETMAQLRALGSLVATVAKHETLMEGLQRALNDLRAEVAGLRETVARDRDYFEDELDKRDRAHEERERVRTSEKRATWLALGALFVTLLGVGIAYAQLRAGAH